MLRNTIVSSEIIKTLYELDKNTEMNIIGTHLGIKGTDERIKVKTKLGQVQLRYVALESDLESFGAYKIVFEFKDLEIDMIEER